MHKQVISVVLMVLVSPAIVTGIVWYSIERGFQLGGSWASKFGDWMAK